MQHTPERRIFDVVIRVVQMASSKTRSVCLQRFKAQITFFTRCTGHPCDHGRIAIMRRYDCILGPVSKLYCQNSQLAPGQVPLLCSSQTYVPKTCARRKQCKNIVTFTVILYCCNAIFSMLFCNYGHISFIHIQKNQLLIT